MVILAVIILLLRLSPKQASHQHLQCLLPCLSRTQASEYDDDWVHVTRLCLSVMLFLCFLSFSSCSLLSYLTSGL